MNPRARASIRLLAAACGAAVASVYYAQPLLAAIATDLRVPAAAAGNVVAAAQVGYALGLLLLVPLGDLLSRPRLIVGQLLLLCAALLAVAAAQSQWMLLAAMAVVGSAAVVAQTMVAHASLLVPAERRGEAVGTLTAGIVIGIVSARVLGGFLGEFGGWRMVYALAALICAAIAIALWRVLPRDAPDAPGLSYPRLVGSVLSLFAREPMLRARGFIGLFAFSAVTMLLTPLALALSRAPWQLSAAQVGLFGLSGIAGALGARYAGRRTDAGGAHAMTLLGLSLMLFAWTAVAMLPVSLVPFALGVLVFDFGLQAVHVANQGVIYATVSRARSRLAAGYMVFYSVGCAAGAALSTRVFEQAGWSGVCAAGAACTLAAWACWLGSRRAAGLDGLGRAAQKAGAEHAGGHE
jgi:predicted MFS family arabinose efflux permease